MLNLRTEVLFYAGISEDSVSETFTLEELGFTDDDIHELSESEIEQRINEMYEEWYQDQIDAWWDFK